VGYARKGDKKVEIKRGGGGGGVEHFTITVKMLQMFIFYKNDTSKGQNTTREPRFEASKNKSCTSMCASVNDVNMNVVADPEARYCLRPVAYSSGQRAATVENTRLRSFLIATVFHQAAGVMDSSTGRHSLYFQSSYPRLK
jgi:hypothetical protein